MDTEFGKEFVQHDIGLGGYLDIDIVNKVNMQLNSPEEMFYIALDKALRILDIDPPEQRKIKDLSTKLPYFTFKNATTFVLGCMATLNSEDETLSRKDLQSVFDLLPTFKESENIEEVDVVRYARFALKEGFRFNK